MPKRKRVDEGNAAEMQVGKPDRPPTNFEQRLYQALRRNPFAPVVPCHRVVASDLDIGGFSGGWGISDPKVQRKRKLLEDEGVKFDGSVVRSRDFVLGPDELQRLLSQARAAASSSGAGEEAAAA